MTFEIYTFGSGSYVVEALHAIKMFMGSNSYSTLARIAGLIALLWVLLAALRNKSGGTIQADWSWLLFFMFFYVGLIVPKADVVVIDEIDPPTTASPVVTNVPLGVAALAYITTGIGHGLVDKYETFITIPGDQKYSENGMLFGSNVARALGEMDFPDPAYSSDMNLFIQHCMFPLITSSSGYALPLDVLSTSDDLWMEMKSRSQKNRWVEFSDGTVRTCFDAMTSLDNRMNGQVNTAAGLAGQKLWPTKNLSTAQAAFLSSSGGATAADFMGVTKTGADLTRQAMMIKSVSGALEGASIDSNNQAMAQGVYQAKAEIQQRNMYITMGDMASRTLPIMKAVMEAISYAIAPLVFLFILMPGGVSAFGQYALFMVWLQTWPILYAIINSVMYWYGSRSSTNSSLLSDGSYGMAMETMNSIFSTNADMVALAGYMALSIPMISYMLIKGGLNAGGSVYSSLMQPASSAASTASAEQTNGSMTMNSLTMDSANWNNMSANKMNTDTSMSWGQRIMTNAAGDTVTSTRLNQAVKDQPGMAQEGMYVSQMKDSFRATASINTQEVASAKESLSQAQSRQASSEKAYESSLSSARQSVSSLLVSLARGEDRGETYNYGSMGQVGDSVKSMVSNIRSIADSASTTGEDREAVMSKIGGSLAFGTGGGKGGVDAGVSATDTTSLAIQKGIGNNRQLQDAFSGENLSSFARTFQGSESFNSFVRSNFAGSDQLSASLTNMQTSKEALREAMQDTATYQTGYDKAVSESYSVQTDQTKIARDLYWGAGGQNLSGEEQQRLLVGKSGFDPALNPSNANDLRDKANALGIPDAGLSSAVRSGVASGEGMVNSAHDTNLSAVNAGQGSEGVSPGGHLQNDVSGKVNAGQTMSKGSVNHASATLNAQEQARDKLLSQGADAVYDADKRQALKDMALEGRGFDLNANALNEQRLGNGSPFASDSGIVTRNDGFSQRDSAKAAIGEQGARDFAGSEVRGSDGQWRSEAEVFAGKDTRDLTNNAAHGYVREEVATPGVNKSAASLDTVEKAGVLMPGDTAFRDNDRGIHAMRTVSDVVQGAENLIFGSPEKEPTAPASPWKDANDGGGQPSPQQPPLQTGEIASEKKNDDVGAWGVALKAVDSVFNAVIPAANASSMPIPQEERGRFSGSDTPEGNPVAGGGRVSSDFGGRVHPVLGVWKQHDGIDIAAPKGTQVSSTADGVVKFSGTKGGYGNIVIVDHGGGLETRYAHLNSFAMGMREGQSVKAGDMIGTVGSTGRSTGNHLHYEVRENGRAVNPSKFIGN
jgi:murein DD-endopeptidase MepM/ murein hydrolase activator NlpD